MESSFEVTKNKRGMTIHHVDEKGFVNQNLVDNEVTKDDENNESVKESATDSDSQEQEQDKHEDIYDYVSQKVKQVIEEKGKYIFHVEPSSELESRPLTTLEDGCKYLGQWNALTNQKESQGV